MFSFIYSHGHHKVFSCRGLCVDHFRQLGHPVTVVVPVTRRQVPQELPMTDQHILEKLYREKLMRFTDKGVHDDRYVWSLCSWNIGL